MFRLWCKLFDDGNHLIKDTVIENEAMDLSRTQKIFAGIESACYQFDLSKPIWLENSVEEFKRHDKVKFSKDNFIDDIDFDFFEIHVIEE